MTGDRMKHTVTVNKTAYISGVEDSWKHLGYCRYATQQNILLRSRETQSKVFKVNKFNSHCQEAIFHVNFQTFHS